MNILLDTKILQYFAFIYGLLHLILLNAKLVRRNPQDIQNDNSKMRKHYATHGLTITFIRLVVVTITLAITVRFADMKLFWGVLLFIYVISIVVSIWLLNNRLPRELPKISNEQVNREIKVKWLHFAAQFIFMIIWLYSWRHLYF